jgi:hypothetical protein
MHSIVQKCFGKSMNYFKLFSPYSSMRFEEILRKTIAELENEINCTQLYLFFNTNFIKTTYKQWMLW